MRPHRDLSALPATPNDRASLDRRGQCAPGSRPAYLIDQGAAAEEIGRLRWALTQVIMLADDAPVLTDEQLRDRLLALADQARPRGQ